MNHCILVPTTILLACTVHLLQGASLILTPSRDTSLFLTVPNNNVGGAQSLASGGTANKGPVRMLIRFDPGASAPAGSVVTNVTLALTEVLAPSLAQASTFGLHRLLVDWGEGTGGEGVDIGTGRLAVNGEATWNNRRHPSTAWSLAGARPGVDYVATPSGTAFVNIGVSTFQSTPELIEDVQQWLENPASNFGWIVISQSESTTRTARRFGSKEHPVLTSRPTLRFSFAPFLIDNVVGASNRIGFEFPGQKGGAYRVEQTPSFEPLSWNPLTNIGPAQAAGRLSVRAPTDLAAAFYRIKRLAVIATQPQSQAVNVGETAQFSVVVSSPPNLPYQWRFNGNSISGATNSTLTLTNVDADDLGEYTVLIGSGLDSIPSAPAYLTLRVAPTIVQQPQSQSVVVGSTVVFNVAVTNTATLPVWYRWRKGGSTLALQMLNERTASFTIPDVQLSSAGNYSVVVSNAVSFTPGLASSTAVLTVNSP